MQSKVKSSQKINFIKRNKQSIAAQKANRSKSTALSSISTNICANALPDHQKLSNHLPKSHIPGFSFCLSFPEVAYFSEEYNAEKVIDEFELYPKIHYSDTDCPPTPPDYRLEEIKEKTEELMSPETKDVKNVEIQTEAKDLRKNRIVLSIRRSERLAKSRGLKRKVSQGLCIQKKIKFN